MNFNPKVWGNDGWTFLRYTALGLPDNPTNEKKNKYKQLFESLAYTLPCEKCQVNYLNHWNKYPIDEYLIGPKKLFTWVNLIYNDIQRMNNSTTIDNEVLYNHMINKNININKPFINRPKKNRIRKATMSTQERRKKMEARIAEMNYKVANIKCNKC